MAKQEFETIYAEHSGLFKFYSLFRPLENKMRQLYNSNQGNPYVSQELVKIAQEVYEMIGNDVGALLQLDVNLFRWRDFFAGKEFDDYGSEIQTFDYSDVYVSIVSSDDNTITEEIMHESKFHFD